MKRPDNPTPLASIVIIVLLAAGMFAWQNAQIRALQRSVSDLQASINAFTAAAHMTAASTTASISEIAQNEKIAAGAQAPKLENVVASVTPAVVSIVESKEVPKLEVSYENENPFGNDPFFGGFTMQVPVYRQVGTTTQKVAAGTGFLVRSNGYIVTNKHVVPDANATYTVVLASGEKLNGAVIWRSPTKDLAVVKIAGTNYATIPFGDSASLELGESVFAIGNALGQYNNSVSTGVISGLDRSITAYNDQGVPETLNGVIQTDAAINPGNSGGPLVDLSGNVIGIDVATVQGSQNIGFAIPSNEVKAALSSLGI